VILKVFIVIVDTSEALHGSESGSDSDGKDECSFADLMQTYHHGDILDLLIPFFYLAVIGMATDQVVYLDQR